MTQYKSFSKEKQKLQTLINSDNKSQNELSKKENGSEIINENRNTFRVPRALFDSGWITATPGGTGG